MAKGIYSSGMSAWERHKAGLAPDHAGPGNIDDGKKPEIKPEKVVADPAVVVEEVVEEPKEDVKAEKKAEKKSFNDKAKDKFRGKGKSKDKK